MKLVLLTDEDYEKIKSAKKQGVFTVNDNTTLSDIVLRNEVLAAKVWTNEDIGTVLRERGYRATEKQVTAVINTGKLRELEECTDTDWELIGYACSCAGFVSKR